MSEQSTDFAYPVQMHCTKHTLNPVTFGHLVKYFTIFLIKKNYRHDRLNISRGPL